MGERPSGPSHRREPSTSSLYMQLLSSLASDLDFMLSDLCPSPPPLSSPLSIISSIRNSALHSTPTVRGGADGITEDEIEEAFREVDVKMLITQYTALLLQTTKKTALVAPTFIHDRDRNKAIPAASKLYIALRYLATGSFLLSAADFSGVSTSSACRYIHQVCRAIARLRPRFISFPTTDDDRRRVAQGFYERNRFPRVLGAVDCTHVKIQSPGGDDAETFRNRKQYFSINVQCICDARLKIMDIVARWPGSSHDQTIFNNSAAKFKFETGVMRGYYLLGDGGYEVTSYLMTPILAPATRAQQLYNESQIRTRNVIERCFGVVKRRFPVLSKGVTVHIDNTQAIIVACAVLHNICIDMHDDLPNGRNENMSGDENDDDQDSDSENDEPYAPTLRGRQERDRLIRDYFANLE